jgi:hypothetical protein
MVRFPIKLVHCSQHALNYGLWVAKLYIPKLRVSTQFIVDEITSQQKNAKLKDIFRFGGWGNHALQGLEIMSFIPGTSE